MSTIKEIIIGQIPDDFSPERHIPIAPFCFYQKEDIYPEWESLIFEPDPINTKEKHLLADEFTSQYVNERIVGLGEELNVKLNLNYSFYFWKTMLNPWLLTLIQVTWERQLRVEALIEKYKNQTIKIKLVKDNIPWVFADTQDYIWEALKPLYNQWLISRIIENSIPSLWQVEWVDKSEQYQASMPKRDQKSKSIKVAISKIINASTYRCYSIPGFNLIDRLIAQALLGIRRKNKQNAISSEDEKRQQSELKWLLNINEIIQKSIPLSILNIPEKVKHIPNKFKEGSYILGSKQLWYDSVDSKLLTALAIESNEKVIGVQHGGPTYGTDISRIIYELEYRLNGFITWGWTELNDFNANFIPLPCPMLSKVIDKHKKEDNNILLVGTRAALFGITYTSTIISKESLVYRKNKLDFISSLSEKHLSNFLYRPYFVEFGALDDRSFFSKNSPNIKLLDGNLHRAMLKCQLLVLDHPGTTMCIALVANIPTICFWAKSNYHFSKQAEPYFELLELAGILFNSGNEAAASINAMNDAEIAAWWNTSKVQHARKEWCNNYALAKKSWRWDWYKFLFKLQ